jgi:predicted DNA-binding transcriptional regulator YafY
MTTSVDPERLKQALLAIREAGAGGLTKAGLRARLQDQDPSGEVSVKTVERCVARLQEDGAKVRKERRDGQRIYVLERGPKWDEHVSGEARLALKLASLVLSQSGTLLWQEKLDLLARVASNHMSSRDRRLFDQLEQAVHVYGGAEDSVEGSADETLEPILEALADHRRVLVDYQAAGAGAAQSYDLIPCSLTQDLFSGGAYLLAWDPGREKTLLLRLNRIARVRPGRRWGALPHQEKVERALKYQIGSWQGDAEPYQVVVRIRGRHWVQALRDAPPALPDCQSSLEAGGEALVLRFQANHENGALRWVLQFGECAEVLEPAFLRRRVREKLAEALAHYGTD